MSVVNSKSVTNSIMSAGDQYISVSVSKMYQDYTETVSAESLIAQQQFQTFVVDSCHIHLMACLPALASNMSSRSGILHYSSTWMVSSGAYSMLSRLTSEMLSVPASAQMFIKFLPKTDLTQFFCFTRRYLRWGVSLYSNPPPHVRIQLWTPLVRFQNMWEVWNIQKYKKSSMQLRARSPILFWCFIFVPMFTAPVALLSS